jgi:hypothetical protein
MNRIDLFVDARERLATLYSRYPEASVVISMQKQLDYLIDLESGTISDRSKLKEIILGVQVAREIEPRDEETASILYKVVDAVEEMKRAKSAK